MIAVSTHANDGLENFAGHVSDSFLNLQERHYGIPGRAKALYGPSRVL